MASSTFSIVLSQSLESWLQLLRLTTAHFYSAFHLLLQPKLNESQMKICRPTTIVRVLEVRRDKYRIMLQRLMHEIEWIPVATQSNVCHKTVRYNRTGSMKCGRLLSFRIAWRMTPVLNNLQESHMISPSVWWFGNEKWLLSGKISSYPKYSWLLQTILKSFLWWSPTSKCITAQSRMNLWSTWS